MRRERIIALAAVLIWVYVLLAVLLNPVYTAPNIPANPIMPFLPADIVNQLWPLVLISTPFVLLAGQRFVHPREASTGRVSPQESARIQARARATSELIREEVGRSETRRPRASTREIASPEKEEQPIILPESAEQKTSAEEVQLAPKGDEAEFTPPPLAPRGDQASAGVTTSDAEKRETNKSAPELTEAEPGRESGTARRIDELEAERAAAASLMDRLEEMNRLGTIQPELYDKLKKKYISTLEKINARMKKLPPSQE